jgi:hypothetical protein
MQTDPTWIVPFYKLNVESSIVTCLCATILNVDTVVTQLIVTSLFVRPVQNLSLATSHASSDTQLLSQPNVSFAASL